MREVVLMTLLIMMFLCCRLYHLGNTNGFSSYVNRIDENWHHHNISVAVVMYIFYHFYITGSYVGWLYLKSSILLPVSTRSVYIQFMKHEWLHPTSSRAYRLKAFSKGWGVRHSRTYVRSLCQILLEFSPYTTHSQCDCSRYDFFFYDKKL